VTEADDFGRDDARRLQEVFRPLDPSPDASLNWAQRRLFYVSKTVGHCAGLLTTLSILMTRPGNPIHERSKRARTHLNAASRNLTAAMAEGSQPGARA
jgi:hypothetical protein